MSAQPPASPSPNVAPPTPLPKDDATVGIHSRPLTASSAGQEIGSTLAGTLQAAEPSGPSRLVIPMAGVASSTMVTHGDPTRPPRTPPGPDNPFKSPEGSQFSHHGLHHFDSQSRVSHKVPNQGNSVSLLPHDGDSHPLPPPPPQPVRLSDRPPAGRQWTGGTRTSNRRSAIDWIVPVSEEGEVQEKVSPQSSLTLQFPCIDLTSIEAVFSTSSCLCSHLQAAP